MPVDEAIFTGRITEEEFKHERLNQYKRLQNQRQLDNYKNCPAFFVCKFSNQAVCSSNFDYRADHGRPDVFSTSRLGYLI